MGVEVCIATKDNNTIVQRQFHAPVTHTCIFFSKFAKIRRECIKNHIYILFFHLITFHIIQYQLKTQTLR